VALKLVVALILAAALSPAQMWRDPMLTIDLEDPSRISAWLTWPDSVPVPEPVAQAFTQAVGCPPDALPKETRIRNVHVECPARLNKNGLRWSAHWDFTALNAALGRAGVEAIEINVSHPRTGFSRVQPAALAQFQGAGLVVSYQGHLRLAEFHDVTLEAGVLKQQMWLVAAVAGAILFAPFLLFLVRSGGPLATMAGANVLFLLAGSAWLAVTLPINVAASLPFPLNLALVFAPVLAAVGIGSRIAGGPRWRLFFWKGARAVALLSLAQGIFSSLPSMVEWAISCVGTFFLCFWLLHRAGGYRAQPLAEGELLNRIRQLAARAGTSITSVQLLMGGEERPAAFATRYRGILLTGGLLSALSRREVDAIVAHELSHVRHPRVALTRGILFLVPFAVMMSFLVRDSLQWMPLLLPPAFLLQRAVRRWNERRADDDAVTWSGDPEALITGLVRVTRANDMPIEWPRWVQLLMPHPSTMQRVRAAAVRGRIPDERLEQMLADSTAPPADGYATPSASSPAGSVFTPDARARLIRNLSLVSFALPVACGVASPYIGSIAALLIGAVSVCLVTDWILTRTRMRARGLLGGRPGVFGGFSPSLEPRTYDGSYDYDWGFANFEGDCLVFRGDRGSWTVTRDEVERIWLADGPFGWLPHPIVCFQIKSGPAFSIRVFDHSFAFAAPKSAARFMEQAARWHSAANEDGAAHGNFDFAGVHGQPPPPWTWRTMQRTLARYSAATLVIHWLLLMTTPVSEWGDPWRVLGPVAVTCILALFLAYPGLARYRAVKMLQQAT
jgi:Zn-dependent protease with chaperone function